MTKEQAYQIIDDIDNLVYDLNIKSLSNGCIYYNKNYKGNNIHCGICNKFILFEDTATYSCKFKEHKDLYEEHNIIIATHLQTHEEYLKKLTVFK